MFINENNYFRKMDGTQMAKCKSCKKDILEGSIYCEDCLHKDGAKSNESYLDDLLNSVIQPKASNNIDFVDDQDIKDFDQFDIMVDLEDSENYNDQADFSDLDDEISISDEDLFGISLGEEDEYQEEVEYKEEQVEFQEEDNIPLADEVNAFEPEDESEDAISPIGLPDDLDFESSNIDNIDGEDNVEPLENMSFSNDIDEDILSLLNQMSSDDPFMAGITDILEGNSYDEVEEKIKPTDTEDILSDVLAGVPSTDEDEMITGISQSLSEDDVEKRKLEKQEKFKKLTSETESLTLSEKPKEKAKNKKPNVFSKILLGLGSKATKSEQTKDETVIDNEETGEKKSVKKPRVKVNKANKATKKAKDKSKALDVKEDDLDEEQKSDSQGNKNISKKEARKAKKAEKKKAKAITVVVEEVEEDSGTINPVGTAITLLAFGAIAIVIYFGTQSFAYNSGIKKTKDYFAKKEYSKAYEEISGMDFKEDDVEIYNKLQTVMVVNKQLNSYYNYNEINKYPEALDSLLKGLQRYDKYIELATFYGVKSDLDYVRDQILVELTSSFSLTEEEAIEIISIGNKTEYSTEVYKVAIGNN